MSYPIKISVCLTSQCSNLTFFSLLASPLPSPSLAPGWELFNRKASIIRLVTGYDCEIIRQRRMLPHHHPHVCEPVSSGLSIRLKHVCMCVCVCVCVCVCDDGDVQSKHKVRQRIIICRRNEQFVSLQSQNNNWSLSCLLVLVKVSLTLALINFFKLIDEN